MNAAVIVAGGTGERVGREGGKQLAMVAGRPVLTHTLEAFVHCDAIDAIVVVVHPARLDEYRAEAIDVLGSSKVHAVVGGGATRQQSVASGLAAVPASADVIAVHDGARPLVTPALIAAAIDALRAEASADGVVVGHPSYDTLKTVDPAGRVSATPERSTLWAAQTPQVFRAQVLRDAYADAERDGIVGTDDASLVERAGGTVVMFSGPRDNLKITVPEDVLVAERVLEARGEGGASVSDLRVGTGYDVHAFTAGRPLILGGVEVPAAEGLLGHSDADVLVHAIMDALLGALREGDIGRLFPDTDARYAGISSIELLRRVAELVRERGYRVVDIDAVLVLERPKIAPYRDEMRERIAGALGVSIDRVGVKATTTEGLGFEGRGEGVGAHAIALLERASS